MDYETVFKRYDIRGRHPQEIDHEFVKILGSSISDLIIQKFPKNEIVIGRDTKPSSKKIKRQLISSVYGEIKIKDAGTCTTDLTAYTGMRNQTVSIQITASHMPKVFTGFKLMYPAGNAFENKHLNEIKRTFRQKANREGKISCQERKTTSLNPKQQYLDRIEQKAESLCEGEPKRVVFDHLGGSTRDTIPDILSRLGHQVDVIERDEVASPPNPKESNLDKLKQKVENTDADIGIASDMDGDRFKAYYNGSFLSGDKVMSMLAKTGNHSLTASVDTSERIKKEVDQVEFTRVGDPFVMSKAVSNESTLAGEANGHFSLPDIVPYPSGTVTAALFATMNLEQAFNNTEKFHVEKSNIETSDKQKTMKRFESKAAKKFEPKNRIDGIKYTAGETTVLVRSSGSEPVIRIKADGPSKFEAEKRVNEARNMIQNS